MRLRAESLSHLLTGPHGWIRLFFSVFARSRRPDGQTPALFVETDIGSAAGVWDVVSRIQQEWGGLN